MDAPSPTANAAQRQRLRALWRSAGWPSQDLVEVELLVAGWVERVRDDAGRETLRLTDAGLAQLAQARRGHQAARGAHEDLCARVAQAMLREGRLAWRGLALRAALSEATADGAARTRWTVAMPDVFSIRQTTREDWLHPVAHEVKVSRADLLADLRRPAKAEAYRALASECWYVLAPGLAQPEEIPPLFGVLQARADGGLDCLRAAPQRPFQPSLGWWMALAKASPERPDEESPQRPLAPAP